MLKFKLDLIEDGIIGTVKFNSYAEMVNAYEWFNPDDDDKSNILSLKYDVESYSFDADEYRKVTVTKVTK